MAAAMFRNPSNPPDDTPAPAQRMMNNNVARPAAGRRHHSSGFSPRNMRYDNAEPGYMPPAPDVPRTRSVSYNTSPTVRGGRPRPYAPRAGDAPDMNKALPPEPSSAGDFRRPRYSVGSGSPGSNTIPQLDGSLTVPSSLEPSSQPTVSTRRASSVKKHDWAHDRSPLQKLEITIDGISKEEKRARVQDAELRHHERMARKEAENKHETESVERRHSAAIKGLSPKTRDAGPNRAVSNKEQNRGPPAIPQGNIQIQKRPERGHVTSERHEARDVQAEELAARPQFAGHNRAPSLQYPAMRPPRQSSYANDGRPVESTARRGSAPRRSVTVNDQPVSYGPNTPSPPRDARENISAFHKTASQVKQLPIQSLASEQASSKSSRQSASLDSGELQKGQMSQSPRTAPQNREIGAQQQRAGPYPVAEEANTPSASPGIDHGVNDHDRPENGLISHSKPKKHTVSFDVPPSPPPIEEWKNAPIARLVASDFDFHGFDAEKGKAWWEGGASNRRTSRALPKDYEEPAQKPKVSKTFQPPIFLKCGPLLRYTGMKRTRVDGPSGTVDKETWRGTIMIVTMNSRSSYETPPTLRLFSQPMDLLPPPPVEVSTDKLASEYIDPTAGLMKLGRDGRPLYVKPVDHTEEEMDLSFIESDDGIYEMSPSLVDYSSEGVKQPIPANRVHSTDGETVGAYKEIAGARLYVDPGRDATFWRFNVEVELGPKQQRIAYRLNQGPALGFWVPAQGQSMNIMFHTSNGFSPGIDSNIFSGPDPLWRDIINEHQTRPFHVMLGGGDQIFNDRVIEESMYLQDWMRIKNINEKHNAPFSSEFKSELESFYLDNYCKWFSQGLFSFANSQIPMVNMWNDHEILDGFGSYPDEFMGTPVISGLGKIAFKYYLLFQHHSVPEETEADEPSWLLGGNLGPYISEKSRSVFLSLGKGVSYLGLDCRTERMSNEVLSEQSCDLIWDRCHREIVKGETKHLIVLLSIPIAYPRVAVVKNILNSRNTLGKAGIFGGFVNRNRSNVAIHDDHWTAKHHKSERKWLIEDLQDLAAEKSVRVTILSGDVHLAAIGQFYSNPHLDLAKDRDYRYMPNIISSAIADAPETEMISDTLNKRNRVHHMDSNTDEDIIPVFTHDVDGKSRNNKKLLPRRNWCSIREYQPGTTPPSTPEAQPDASSAPRPGMLQRSLSMSRGDRPASSGGFLRRLSLRGPPPTRDFSQNRGGRRMSMDGPYPPVETGDSYFHSQPNEQRPGPFLRRPTNLSQKATRRAIERGDDDVGGIVNLEGGLAVILNLEVNPSDPSGITAPYKLLVPMLRYDGSHYDPPPTQVTKGWKKWLGMRRHKDREPSDEGDSDEEEDYDDGAEYEDEDVPENLVPMKQHSTEEEEPRGLRQKLFGRRT